MSTSISLGTSADLDTLDSKHNFETNSCKSGIAANDDPNPHEREIKNLKHWAHPLNKSTENLGGALNRRLRDRPLFRTQDRLARDFYEEVDERMSRNSFEYPDEQAKYVGDWLNNANFSVSKSTDEENFNWGRVIGIRGFKSNSQKKDSKERTNYNKLKFEFSKLQREHEKLHTRLRDTIVQFKSLARRKDNDIDILKTLISHRRICPSAESTQLCKDCTCERHAHQDAARCRSREATDRAEELKSKLKQTEMNLRQSEENNAKKMAALRSENEQLKSDRERAREEFEKEINSMRCQIKALSLEPSNRTLIAIQNENSRLKDLTEADILQYQELKENYRQLESHYLTLLDEQKRLEAGKNEEASNLLVELCRLQVYQPKLEMLLETEREIKAELQLRINHLEETVGYLRAELESNNADLIGEKLRAKKVETVDLERLHQEVAKWQEKYCRLEREKADVEDLLRAARSKVAVLDARYLSQVEEVREGKQVELDKARSDMLRLGHERNRLEAKLEELAKQMEVSDSERRKLDDEVVRLTKELQVSIAERQSMRGGASILGEAQDRIRKLTDQLRASETRNGQLFNERELCNGQNERLKLQAEQLKQRIHLQQKAFDEFKERRDKELARLRGNLKFEHYNRQAALKGIEKELRVSLGELETIKYRFSQRMAQSDSKASPAVDSNQNVPPTANGSNCSRNVQKAERLQSNTKGRSDFRAFAR